MFDGFWDNVFRYPRYFITTLLGVFLNAFGWIEPVFKRPATLIAFISLLVGILVFVSFTLRAMLGLSTI
ncbi:Protein of unknown function (DUF751) [Rivularia sp. PCC 7116]|uniref:DUF751 family protein n=1 Tax=Rivularia sp. PCC 7116 TaxID=373994 RepID=UPI00029ED8B7|nr:DUF751 family protein [Rivularia sp. PCC 7116]AFY57092.1 Protein of unknown function (DUF751) [Rivularia sp. PCC 7116]